MKNNFFHSKRFFNSRSIRLASSIALAFMLAGVIFLLPLASQGGVETGQPSSHALQRALSLGPTLVRAANGLTITKVAPLTVGPGNVMNYTITVTNTTGGPLNSGDSVLVYEALPNDVTVDCSSTEANSPPGWIADCSPREENNEIGWILFDNFADGDSVDFIFTVQVDEPLTDSRQIVNDNYFVSLSSVTDTYGSPFITVVEAPAWSITKTAASDTVAPGQEIAYTITAINTGQGATSGVYTITDDLPPYTDPGTVQSSPPANVTGSTLTWTFSDVLAGDGAGSKTVSYSVQANSPLTDGLKIVNDGYTVSGGNVFTPTTTNEPVTVTVESIANLGITKVASPDPVVIGNSLVYTITVVNNSSTGPAIDLLITDTLSPDVTYQPGSAGFVGGVTGTITDTGGNPIIWAPDDVLSPNDSLQVTLTAAVNGGLLPSPPLITNTFQASAANADLVSGAMAVDVVPDVPDTITVTVAAHSLQICETTTVTATLVDQWNNPLSGKTVSLLVSDAGGGQAELLSNSGSTDANGVFKATLTAIDAGQVNVWGWWKSPSEVFDSSGDIIISSPAVPDQLTLSVSPNPLAAGGATATVDGRLTYCKSELNSGKTITFTLSDLGLAAFAGPSDTATATTNSNGVATVLLASTPTPPTPGTLTITGTGEGLQDIVTLDIHTPVLTITKTADPPAEVSSRGDLDYIVRVDNIGDVDATNVWLTDTLPLSVSYVSLTPSRNGNGSLIGPTHPSSNIVALGIDKLEPGKSLTATIRVTVTATLSGTSLTNIAQAKSNATNLIDSNRVRHTVVTIITPGDTNVYLPIVVKN